MSRSPEAKARLQQLRDHIANEPEEAFCYRYLFGVPERSILSGPSGYRAQVLQTVPRPHCGTAGCVAGTGMMLFAPGASLEVKEDLGEKLADFYVAANTLRPLLELDENQFDFLCILFCRAANKADAVKRLDFLLSESQDTYPLDQESWWESFMDGRDDPDLSRDVLYCHVGAVLNGEADAAERPEAAVEC